MRHNRVLRSLIVWVLSLAALQAETPTLQSWENLQALQASQEIQVRTARAKESGAFVSVTESGIAYRSSGLPEKVVPRDEVTRVYVRTRSHRLRNTIIGAGVGTAIGIVMYGTLGAYFRNEVGDNTEAMIAIPALAGTAIGAAARTGTMKLIYKAPAVRPAKP